MLGNNVGVWLWSFSLTSNGVKSFSHWWHSVLEIWELNFLISLLVKACDYLRSTGLSWLIKRVHGIVGSSFILVFSSKCCFQIYALLMDSGFDVLATMMHPETWRVNKGWNVVCGLYFYPWSHNWRRTFLPSMYMNLRLKSELTFPWRCFFLGV